jgi:hypothetical protein
LLLPTIETDFAILSCLAVALAGDEELQQDPKMASFLDEVNAYSYLYPLELPSKNFVFKWYVCMYAFACHFILFSFSLT